MLGSSIFQKFGLQSNGLVEASPEGEVDLLQQIPAFIGIGFVRAAETLES